MGRSGSGVETRPTSIRLSFSFEGRQCRETLRIKGEIAAPTLANQRYAERLAREIRDKIKHGVFVYADYFPASGTTGRGLVLGDWLDTWLGAQRVEHSTKAGYSSAARFWKESAIDDAGTQLGALPLRTVTHSMLLTALAKRPDLSGKTVNNYVSVLREAFDLAQADKIIDDNPAAAIKRAAHQTEPPDPFTRDEAEQIIAAALRRYPEPVANLIEWRFFTGVRTSEMAGLRWPSVDLQRGEFAVREAIVRGLDKGKTKTNRVRIVRLNSRAAAALERQRKHTQLAGDHVWLDPRYGTPWTEERAFRRSYWTPLLKALGIRYRAPNHMRHTYATMMLMAGAAPAWCAKQLGHSVEVFLRTYSRWLDGAQDAVELARVERGITGGTAAEESAGG